MKLFSVLVTCLATIASHAWATTLNYAVPSTANIFSAGLAAPVAPGGGGAGSLPVEVNFASGQGFSFQFASSGIVSPYFSLYSLGAEGLASTTTTINSAGGISGFLSERAFPLVGVFLTDATPTAPAPATLDFTAGGIGRNFLSLAPEIGQVFFIGDGQADDSFLQSFIAPGAATRLFLGFPDAPNFINNPGSYADNTGQLNVQVTVVPEPAVSGLMLLGLGAGAVIRQRRNRYAYI